MRDQAQAATQILAQVNGLPFHLTPCSGSSNSTTYLLSCYAKMGPMVDVQQEYQAYQRLASASCGEAEKILPKVTAPHVLNDGQCLFFVEPVRGQSLEAAIFAFGNGQGEDRIQRGTSVVGMIHHALEHLRCIRRGSLVQSSQHTIEAVGELVDALQVNMVRGGLDASAIGLPRASAERWAKERLSVAHRDLSVVNIIGNGDGVMFIDPRLAVPNLDHGVGLTSPALDLVTLAVSLERKQAELQRDDPACVLPGLTLVHHELDVLERQGCFSREMRLLCEAVARSVYVACRCEYCTAPSRGWLYGHMVESMRQSIEQLSSS